MRFLGRTGTLSAIAVVGILSAWFTVYRVVVGDRLGVGPVAAGAFSVTMLAPAVVVLRRRLDRWREIAEYWQGSAMDWHDLYYLARPPLRPGQARVDVRDGALLRNLSISRSVDPLSPKEKH